jgi:poly(glycerol-phosphate) alpha-glucosyltransferase
MLVVGIGRYHEFKRWDRAISAFSRVIEKVPDARLELWGFGPEEQALRDLVEQLGLSSHVSIKGITHDAQGVLAGAALSVLSSPAEAFGLVALESMAVGTPMVAFDVTYGMRDQITSGVNGVLVRHADTDALAAAIVDLLLHPRKRLSMGRKALIASQSFGESEWVDSWLAVIDAACEQRQHRTTIQEASALAALGQSRAGLIVRSSVHVEGPPKSDVRLKLYAKSRDPFRDSYGRSAPPRAVRAVPLPSPASQDDLTLAGVLPLKEMRSEKAIWDLYVSCSARNAHRFVRLAAAPGTILDSWTANGVNFKPYVTEGGNLSMRVNPSVPEPSLSKRAARWVRRRLPGRIRT